MKLCSIISASRDIGVVCQQRIHGTSRSKFSVVWQKYTQWIAPILSMSWMANDSTDVVKHTVFTANLDRTCIFRRQKHILCQRKLFYLHCVDSATGRASSLFSRNLGTRPKICSSLLWNCWFCDRKNIRVCKKPASVLMGVALETWTSVK